MRKVSMLNDKTLKLVKANAMNKRKRSRTDVASFVGICQRRYARRKERTIKEVTERARRIYEMKMKAPK